MRHKIWIKLMLWSKQPQGKVLPKWALCVRAVLFPLDFFYWRMNKISGYQMVSDTWRIRGVSYSSSLLDALSTADGEVIRIRRVGDLVTFEKIHNA